MICPKCKKENKDNSRFCSFCGARLKIMLISPETVEQAKAGDQSAISQLYESTYNTVYYTVKTIIIDEDTTQDIVQDAYVKAFANINQLKANGAFVSWVKLIATNRAKDWLKSKKPLLFSEMNSDEEDDFTEPEVADITVSNSPQESLDRDVKKQLLWAIINDLSEEQRVVVNMFYFQQMSVASIAKSLDVSEGTIKSRLNYARKKIEGKVVDLEKNGTKLYGMAPIPFLLWLFTQNQASNSVTIPLGATTGIAKRASEANAILHQRPQGINHYQSESSLTQNQKTGINGKYEQSHNSNFIEENNAISSNSNSAKPVDNIRNCDNIGANKSAEKGSNINSSHSSDSCSSAKSGAQKNSNTTENSKIQQSPETNKSGNTTDSSKIQQSRELGVNDKYNGSSKRQQSPESKKNEYSTENAKVGHNTEASYKSNGAKGSKQISGFRIDSDTGHRILSIPTKGIVAAGMASAVLICAGVSIANHASTKIPDKNGAETTEQQGIVAETDQENLGAMIDDPNSPYSEFYTGSDQYVWAVAPFLEAKNVEMIEVTGATFTGPVSLENIVNMDASNFGGYLDSDVILVENNKWKYALFDYDGKAVTDYEYTYAYSNGGDNLVLIPENKKVSKTLLYTKDGIIPYDEKEDGIESLFNDVRPLQERMYFVPKMWISKDLGLGFGLSSHCACKPQNGFASNTGPAEIFTCSDSNKVSQDDIVYEEAFIDYFNPMGIDIYRSPGGNVGFAPIYEGNRINPDIDYTYVGVYQDGLFAVKKDGKWGYINNEGKTIIPLEYNDAWKQVSFGNSPILSFGYESSTGIAYPASCGYVALYKEGEGSSLVTTAGETVIPVGKYSKIRPVHNGKLWVQDNRTGLWGVLQLTNYNQ